MADPWEEYQAQPWADYEDKPVQGTVRSALQGMTLGGADEAGAGLAAAAAHKGPLTQGLEMLLNPTDPESYQNAGIGDIYNQMMGQLSGERKAFREEHPVLSIGSEIAGGAATGIAGGAKLAGTELGKRVLANTPRWLQAAGLGATEGGIYGGLSSDPGERAGGAGVGAAVGTVAAPVGGFIIDKAGRFGHGVYRWAKNKLASTPKNEAISALRAALQAEGLDPEDAVRMYESLGPDAMLADIGDNFRALARAATDQPGPVKAIAKGALHSRQLGQQQRLVSAAEDIMGVRAQQLPQTVSQLAQDRFTKASPIYTQAFRQGIEPSPRLTGVLDREVMKGPLRQAKKIASGYGDEFSDGSLKHLHYAKMALWDQIERAQRSGNRQLAGALKKTYGDFLDAIGSQNKTYARAYEIWSDDSKLIDAAMTGRSFFKLSAADMSDALEGMTGSEREMFQMGSVAAFQDMLDNVQLTADATRKFINSSGALKKLAMLFGDEDAARAFVNKAQAEAAFVQTRNVVAGGSPTSQNLAGQKFLQDAIQPETLGAIATGDPIAMTLTAARQLLKSKPLSQETLGELGDMLLKQGLQPDEVQKILTNPRVTIALQRMGEQWSQGARAGAGIAGPILGVEDGA